MRLRWNTKCKLCFLPSVAGTMLFFVVPYFRVWYYSLIDNQFDRCFVGIKNYIETLENEYFRLAFRNSILLLLVCVPALVVLALTISIGLFFYVRHIRGLKMVFVIPMLVPTAGIVPIWQMWFGNVECELPIWMLFLWKNLGMCVILLTAALTMLPKEMLEAAKLEGAAGIKLHFGITIPAILPMVLFVILLSVVYTFRIFKESYLYYGGNYPPMYGYHLQYYMNNNFLKFDYQALATSSVLTSLFVVLLVGLFEMVQRRYRE